VKSSIPFLTPPFGGRRGRHLGGRSPKTHRMVTLTVTPQERSTMREKKVADDVGTLATSVSPVEKCREFLATKGFRMTRERSILVEEVFADHEHFDAEQLIQRLARRTDGRRVSRSTIYRALTLLEEAGMLRKVARQDGRDVYEHDFGYPRHDHMICRKCQKLIEFRNTRVRELVEELAAEHGFRLERHRLEVYGLCSDCSRPPASRHKKLNLL
jgi:Fur family ferric uptake transcriptional regulator